MEKEKYSWSFRWSWVVEFVRKDAEISIDLDGERFQKVITKGCKDQAEAEMVARDYCEKMSLALKQAIRQYTAPLKDAKE